jgi:hypothetical protein
MKKAGQAGLPQVAQGWFYLGRPGALSWEGAEAAGADAEELLGALWLDPEDELDPPEEELEEDELDPDEEDPEPEDEWELDEELEPDEPEL